MSEQQLPPVNFVSHVLMMAMTAKQFMGTIKIEGQPDMPQNLPMARHYIDTVIMLQKKTKGNLTDEEDNFVQQTISDLQMEMLKQ